MTSYYDEVHMPAMTKADYTLPPPPPMSEAQLTELRRDTLDLHDQRLNRAITKCGKSPTTAEWLANNNAEVDRLYGSPVKLPFDPLWASRAAEIPGFPMAGVVLAPVDAEAD